MTEMHVQKAYKMQDLDRALRRDVLDIIDYHYRFRKNPEQDVSDVIKDNMNTVRDKVTEFYAGIDGVSFDIGVEDLEKEYRQAMC